MEATARSARQVADELRAAVLAERRAQAAKLALVCELADTYRSVLPALDLPGAPQLVSAGGDGTPEIDEFLVQEIHPLLGVGPAAAWSLLRQATNLRDRHPKVWALVQAGVVPAWQGRQVAELCQALPSEAAGYVDEQVALPLTHLPWPRVRRRLMGLIVAADTELAAEQAARARRGRFVRIKHNDDGTSWLLALLTTAEAVRLDETITTIARSICDDPDYVGGPDEARADAFGVLVTPSKAGQSAVVGSAPATLVVHLDHTASPVARLARGGGPGRRTRRPGRHRPRPARTGVRTTGPSPSTSTTSDRPGRPISADAYEIPDRLRTKCSYATPTRCSPTTPHAPEPATSTTPTRGDKAAHQTKPEHRTWQRWAADPTEPKPSAPGNSNNPDPECSTGPHHSATTTASTTKAPPGSTTPTDSTSPTA